MEPKTCSRCHQALRNDAYGSLCEDCYVDCTTGYGYNPKRRQDGSGNYRHANKSDWKEEEKKHE